MTIMFVLICQPNGLSQCNQSVWCIVYPLNFYWFQWISEETKWSKNQCWMAFVFLFLCTTAYRIFLFLVLFYSPSLPVSLAYMFFVHFFWQTTMIWHRNSSSVQLHSINQLVSIEFQSTCIAYTHFTISHFGYWFRRHCCHTEKKWKLSIHSSWLSHNAWLDAEYLMRTHATFCSFKTIFHCFIHFRCVLICIVFYSF